MFESQVTSKTGVVLVGIRGAFAFFLDVITQKDPLPLSFFIAVVTFYLRRKGEAKGKSHALLGTPAGLCLR